jgi:outer membrane protein OmpA-like peptidoglycan-associated protein/tetratricopeptide (TPR) repeat protein
MLVTIFRVLSLLLFALMISACASAQPGSSLSSSLTRKDRKVFAAAQSELSLSNFTDARKLLDGLIMRNPDQAQFYYLRSLTHKSSGDLPAAISDIEAGTKRESETAGVSWKELAELYGRNGQFNKAITAWEAYARSAYVTRKPERLTAAQELLIRARTAARLAATPVPFSPQPIPGAINSPEHLEYFPSLSIDGERMIFTRRVNGQQEDFYLSQRTADGSWSAPTSLEGVNTDFNEGAQTISADGRFLVFTACDRPDGAGSCDLYYAEMDDAGDWSVARNLGPEVNTRDYEAQPSLSADGTVLFFASRRPGGFGNEDLYVCGRLPKGKWSAPVNLGPMINTSGKEQYPFFSSDGATLFFTSNKHPGLGGDDLFRSSLTAANAWGEPQNLGYPINTADDETNLFVAMNGTTAYFSKGRRLAETGKSDVDIYQFELPPDLRPAAATYVKVTITDVTTGQALTANVRIRPTTQDGPPTSQRSGQDGTFTAVLPVGKDYALTIDLPGYLFYAERFSLTDGFTQADPYLLDIALQPVPTISVATSKRAEADGAIAFRNVLFESGSAELLAVSGDELDRLAELLTKAPRFRVEIVGHTDNVGTTQSNLELSQRRAAAVKTYLISRGVTDTRITARGDGEQNPVDTNDTEEGRARNRRTTFRLEQ